MMIFHKPEDSDQKIIGSAPRVHFLGHSHRAGMTAVELLLALTVGFFLIGMSFVGAHTWKEGSDRASCIMNIYKMQGAVRTYAALHHYQLGEDLSVTQPSVSLFSELVGDNKYVSAVPVCPEGGLYRTSSNVIPAYGSLYMTCSLAKTRGHEPEFHENW